MRRRAALRREHDDPIAVPSQVHDRRRVRAPGLGAGRREQQQRRALEVARRPCRRWRGTRRSAERLKSLTAVMRRSAGIGGPRSQQPDPRRSLPADAHNDARGPRPGSISPISTCSRTASRTRSSRRCAATAPVWWHEPTAHTPDGEGFWSVHTHAECMAVIHDPGDVLVGDRRRPPVRRHDDPRPARSPG